MVTDATKTQRAGRVSVAFVGLYALASLLYLFVDTDFTSKAQAVQQVLALLDLGGFAVLLASLGAVALVTGFGGPRTRAP